MHKVLVGQDSLVDGLITGLIAGGHVLIEGVPGLAKTLAAKTLAAVIQADFKRIQFTPDLLPADLTGTPIYRQGSGEFVMRFGPVFSNIVLADEINRAPAKVQSALLEAMEERQITVGDNTYSLKEPFYVVATQNPIELEGTYPLPEAQIDRFLMKLIVDYPEAEEELQVVLQGGGKSLETVQPVLRPVELHRMRETAEAVHMDPRLSAYIVDLVRASRPASGKGFPSAGYIQFGASPRGSLSLFICSKIRALLSGRDYVLPEDIKEAVYPVLRHRIILSYQAEADEISPDDLLSSILESVPIP
jgi:MoxR-like ATPase